MANYIVIDGGTTNTRLTLVCNGAIIARRQVPIGAGSGDSALLRKTVKAGIEAVLTEGKRTAEEITCILAAGMITSEKGLYEVPHLPLPAGATELKRGLCRQTLAEISPIPFCFIPGLKSAADSIEHADMMRGEEAELMGLFAGEGLYILPGSHSKLITADASGRITSIQTMLSGEMMAALSHHTILKDAVAGGSATDADFLCKGYEYADTRGLNEALFKVRVLKTQFGCSADQVYSFFMGAVLCGEIKAIRASGAKRIYLGGKAALREPMAVLIRAYSAGELICISDEDAALATTRGMIRIYEEETA